MIKKRPFLCFCVIICVFLVLIITIPLMINRSTKPQYNEEWIIGKTSDEIQERFGEFDGSYSSHPLKYPEYCFDGDYKNAVCYYITKPARVGFLGTDPEERFEIVFDKNGFATSASEQYAPD